MYVSGILLLLTSLALSLPVRSGVLAILLLPHFFPGSVPRPLRAFTAEPTMRTISVPDAPGRMVADIYRPGGKGPFPAMILLLGVNPLPRGHEQVTTLAEGIARTGILTVVAESEALLAGQIRLEEVDNLVALFEYLEQDPDVDPQHIGFSGFCMGAVLELLAAADPRIAARVAYVNAFSVYAFAPDVLRAILSEQMPTPNGSVSWLPSQLTRTVFLRHIIELLPVERDRSSLERELLEATPLTSPEEQALSPAGRQLRALLKSTDPAEIEEHLADLPPEVTRGLERLSPGAQAGDIRAQAFLMHDQSDTYLPVSGARQLAALLERAHGVYYSEFRLFEHVVPAGIDDPVRFAGEMIRLFRHIQSVIQAAQFGHSGA